MSKASVAEQPTGSSHMIVRDENPARQDADRAFQNAHVLVEYQRANAGTLQQRYHRRDQDRVVCTDKFAHGPMTGSFRWNYERRRVLF